MQNLIMLLPTWHIHAYVEPLECLVQNPQFAVNLEIRDAPIFASATRVNQNWVPYHTWRQTRAPMSALANPIELLQHKLLHRLCQNTHPDEADGYILQGRYFLSCHNGGAFSVQTLHREAVMRHKYTPAAIPTHPQYRLDAFRSKLEHGI